MDTGQKIIDFAKRNKKALYATLIISLFLIVVFMVVVFLKGDKQQQGQLPYPYPEPPNPESDSTLAQQAANSTDTEYVKTFVLGIYGAIDAWGYNGLNEYLNNILLLDPSVLKDILIHWDNYYANRMWGSPYLETAIGLESCFLTQLNCDLQRKAIERLNYIRQSL